MAWRCNVLSQRRIWFIQRMQMDRNRSCRFVQCFLSACKFRHWKHESSKLNCRKYEISIQHSVLGHRNCPCNSFISCNFGRFETCCISYRKTSSFYGNSLYHRRIDCDCSTWKYDSSRFCFYS